MAIAVRPSESVNASDVPRDPPGRTAGLSVGELVEEGRPLTWHDLQQLPDGLRYELVDGVLLVSPSPTRVHQRVAANLTIRLGQVLPANLEVLAAPFDWYVSETTVFEPDVIVARADDPGERRLEGVPAMVVEVLSPSTRLRDLGLKRLSYERCGLAWYWVVDPVEPRLTVFRLDDGRYVEDAVVTGDEKYVASEPLPVTIVPSELVEPPGRRV